MDDNSTLGVLQSIVDMPPSMIYLPNFLTSEEEASILSQVGTQKSTIDLPDS